MADGIDPAFPSLQKNNPCFIIWRIESFQLKGVPEDKYGSFYDGDSYITLVQKETKGAMDTRIHFWLGKSTSQDEAGTAAIKAVELDDYLGGTPVQYREVQGSESKVFLSYFKNKGGINYMSGGALSGFNHVDNKIKPRLMQVKGKSCPRMKEVAISWAQMNDGDAFILDIGEAFFVWQGKSCSRTEKLKAMDYARKLRDDRGKGSLVVVEDGDETASSMGGDEFELFDKYLPIDERDQLQPASAAGSDETVERKAAANLKLWKVSDEGGALKITEVSGKPLKKDMLDTNDCFIVDNGEAGVWVWCGKKANKEEKKAAMTNALNFVKQQNYSDNVQVTKVYEMGEPTEFKTLFKVWEKAVLPGSIKPQGNKIARTVQTKFDAGTLHDNPQVARETGMVDDGSGTKQIWRIERQGNNYEKVELKKDFYGQLYGGDSYIILYTYDVNGREQYIIYFWLGRKSTQDEKGVAARLTVELDDSLNGAAKQVRVVHGKEPNHFLAMFGGKLIIFDGGKAGWGGEGEEGPGDTYLLHVRGTSSINTKAEQVDLTAESLNSNDVFVLVYKNASDIWAGKGCTGDEREMAKLIGGMSPKGYNMIVEGQEKEDFWNRLGGKKEYSTSKRLAEPESDHEPRLFQCSNASGNFTCNEIYDFAQVDLVTDDVFFLDAYDQVFVWVGNDARPEEKTMSMDSAIEYIETDPSGRDEGTPVFVVKQGLEPPDFVGYFGVWDRDLWSDGKSYDELKNELGMKNISLDQVKNKSSSGDTPFSGVAKYPYETLILKDSLPDGVDRGHKEKHLSDEEFEQLFNMKYADFVSLPGWKQTNLKKEKQLF